MRAMTTRLRSGRMAALLLGAALLAGGCGTQELTWEAVDVLPNLTVELPGETEVLDEPVPGTDLVLEGLGSEVGDDYYGAVAIQLPAGTPFDLDGSVQGAVDSALADLEGQLGEEGTAEVVELESEEFAGVDSRRYVADMVVGDVDADLYGRVMVIDDQVIQLTAVDGGSDSTEDARRFIDSLAEQ